MTRASTLFLQAVALLIAIITVAFLLMEPHFEGVNANAATLFDIYFDDPLLAYAYIASIPFFVALYQAFKLLGNIGRHETFTPHSVKALETIKYCAITMIPLIVVGVVWILSVESDDRPPILAMGIITSLACIVVATAATVFARTLQKAVDMKSENELTV